MSDQNEGQVQSSDVTPIDNILSGEQTVAAEVTAPEQSGQENAHEGGERQPWDKEHWTFKAYNEEKRKRQGFQSRMRELEEENAALLAGSAVQHDADPEETQRWLDPYGESQRAFALKQTERVSRVEFVAEHGKQALSDLEMLVGQAMQAGHPDLPFLAQSMRASEDPVKVAAMWAGQVMGWRPEAKMQRAPDRPSVMPSNLAGVPNVGSRSGSTWSGPTPINDIFDRTPAKA